MNKRRASDHTNPDLRNKALAKIPNKIPHCRADDRDTEKLLHELQVHQVELQMQNEEIRSLQLQTQEALDRYIDLYDSAPVGYLTLSVDGRISALNLTAATMLGEARSKILGRTLAAYITNKARFRHYLAKISVSDDNVTGEFQILPPREKAIDVQLEGCVSKNKADFHTISIIIIDISKRKSLEKKLQKQSVQMESLLKKQVAIQTASAIARDINQPLTAISLFSEVAAEYLKNNSISLPSLQEALTGIVQQTQRAGESLNRLCEFLESDEIYQDPVDLNSVISNTIELLQYEGVIDDLRFACHLESGLPPALCNYVHIQKVLDNLLQNSIEATQEIKDPSIIISTRTISLSKKSMVQVTIQDNGSVLNTEPVNDFFEPFFTTKQQKIGMGLTMSRALIETNGGELWMDTASKLTTTFHFTLPLQCVAQTKKSMVEKISDD